MGEIFVQFADETESVIVSIFSCEQDPDAHPFQGVVAFDDDRLIAYMEGKPAIVGVE